MCFHLKVYFEPLLTIAVRIFSSLLGQGVTCQWTAASALTFISSPDAPAFASGVFFDGRSSHSPHPRYWCSCGFRHRVCSHPRRCALVVCPARALLPSVGDFTLGRFLGDSVRTCVVGAIPPSHHLELGSCCRSLNEGTSAQRFIFSCFCRGFTWVLLLIMCI
jgi:hypothetical protein